MSGTDARLYRGLCLGSVFFVVLADVVKDARYNIDLSGKVAHLTCGGVGCLGNAGAQRVDLGNIAVDFFRGSRLLGGCRGNGGNPAAGIAGKARKLDVLRSGLQRFDAAFEMADAAIRRIYPNE